MGTGSGTDGRDGAVRCVPGLVPAPNPHPQRYWVWTPSWLAHGATGQGRCWGGPQEGTKPRALRGSPQPRADLCWDPSSCCSPKASLWGAGGMHPISVPLLDPVLGTSVALV